MKAQVHVQSSCGGNSLLLSLRKTWSALHSRFNAKVWVQALLQINADWPVIQHPLISLRTIAAVLGILAVAGAANAASAAGSQLPPRFAAAGPYKVELKRNALCCDRKGNAADLYLPVGGDGTVFPVVTWGNGTWASPEKYDFLLRHLASWGMAVVGTGMPVWRKEKTMLMCWRC